MDAEGNPNCVFHAKLLFVHLVRRGAKVHFVPTDRSAQRKLEAARVEDPEGNETVVLVHKGSTPTRFSLVDLGLPIGSSQVFETAVG